MRKMGTPLKTWNPFPDVGSRCFNNLIFKGFDSDNRPPQRRGGAQRLMNSDSLKHRVRAMHRGAELVYPILAGCGRVGTHRLGAGCQSFSTQLLARRNPRASCSTSCSCARRRTSPRASRIRLRLSYPAQMSLGNLAPVRARAFRFWPLVPARAGFSFLPWSISRSSCSSRSRKFPPSTPETGRHHAQKIGADECENLVVIFASAMMQTKRIPLESPSQRVPRLLPVQVDGQKETERSISNIFKPEP